VDIAMPTDQKLIGLDLRRANPCRCGCATTRVFPHSTKSNLLVWKCSWCKGRKGKVNDDEAAALAAFVSKFGWNLRPLVLNEDGVADVRC
jgi:hypothetical protein